MRALWALALVAASPALAEGLDSREALGEALFFDTDLSRDRTQACATCHDPALAFTDPRETDLGRAVSLGDDGESLGRRNAPTLTYALLTPAFHQLDPGIYAGGFFLDGRAVDLEAQAAGPPLNRVEMAMPDEAAVVARLAEKPAYVTAFDALFGPGVLAAPETGFRAMTEAIAAFERTALFAPFDSRYDRALRGEIRLTATEERGRVLFFSPEGANCVLCHTFNISPQAPNEPFTLFEFHNIGVPAHPGLSDVDHGLLENPGVTELSTDGKFRTPSLRNVAVTGPYMHNGVFAELRTVVAFYNRYNSLDRIWQTNPETGALWGPPEVPATLSVGELTHGPALGEDDIDALVAFLKTLTDARYEPLLDD